jgi:hypothetical protein
VSNIKYVVCMECVRCLYKGGRETMYRSRREGMIISYLNCFIAVVATMTVVTTILLFYSLKV